MISISYSLFPFCFVIFHMHYDVITQWDYRKLAFHQASVISRAS